jgi:hypothetical protein
MVAGSCSEIELHHWRKWENTLVLLDPEIFIDGEEGIFVSELVICSFQTYGNRLLLKCCYSRRMVDKKPEKEPEVITDYVIIYFILLIQYTAEVAHEKRTKTPTTFLSR